MKYESSLPEDKPNTKMKKIKEDIKCRTEFAKEQNKRYAEQGARIQRKRGSVNRKLY